MAKKTGKKIRYGRVTRTEYISKRGKKYITVNKKTIYASQYRSKATGAKKGRPKGSLNKKGRKTVKRSAKSRGAPRKSGIARYPSGRPKYTASGSRKGRPKKTVADIPRTINIMSKGRRKRYTFVSAHTSKKAALSKAPKEHRIQKHAGKWVLYTRGRS